MNMKPILHRAWAEINLDALESNVKAIKEKLPETTDFMAVVKANAYGHGDEAVCKKLWSIGVRWFAVSNLEEALAVRDYCPDSEIFILGYTPSELAEKLVENNIIQGVLSIEYAKELSEHALSPVRCHIKLDTGMGRIGLQCKDIEKCGKEILSVFDLPNLSIEGIYTHFAVADSNSTGDIAYTKQQEERIIGVYDWLANNGHKLQHLHFMNSAASVTNPNPRSTLARAGILMYGLLPNAPFPVPVELKPVMTLKAGISHVKWAETGDCISYGRTYTVQKPIKIATVTIGYADGYARLLSNRASAIVHGVACPVIGRVCMDQLMLDITDVKDEVKPGDEAIMFGEQPLTADHLAGLYGTIGYEIICGISKRVPRIICGEPPQA